VPRVLSLPFYPEMSEQDVLRISNALALIMSKKR